MWNRVSEWALASARADARELVGVGARRPPHPVRPVPVHVRRAWTHRTACVDPVPAAVVTPAGDAGRRADAGSSEPVVDAPSRPGGGPAAGRAARSRPPRRRGGRLAAGDVVGVLLRGSQTRARLRSRRARPARLRRARGVRVDAGRPHRPGVTVAELLRAATRALLEERGAATTRRRWRTPPRWNATPWAGQVAAVQVSAHARPSRTEIGAATTTRCWAWRACSWPRRSGMVAVCVGAARASRRSGRAGRSRAPRACDSSPAACSVHGRYWRGADVGLRVFCACVVGVDFGGREGLALVSVAVCRAARHGARCVRGGAADTATSARSGILTALTCVLSLLSRHSTELRRWSSRTTSPSTLPWTSWVNPAKLACDAFYALYYYTSLAPFAARLAACVAGALALLAVAGAVC